MQNRSRLTRFLIITIVLSLVCMAVLSLVFSQLWKKRADNQTKEDCGIVADAALKQFQSAVKLNENHSEDHLSTVKSKVIVLSWAFLYADSVSESLPDMFSTISFVIDSVSASAGDEFIQIYGDMPEEEYKEALSTFLEDPALQTNDRVSSFSLNDSLYWAFDFDENIWVITKVTDDYLAYSSSVQEFSEMELDTMSYSEPDHGALIVSSLSTGKILDLRGTFSASEGDVLTAVPDKDGRITINGTTYISDYKDSDSLRFTAAVPADTILSRKIVSPYLLAALFTLLFILVSIYGWFLRTDILHKRVELEYSQSSSADSLLKGFLKRIRLFFITAAVLISLLITLLLSLELIDEIRIRNTALLDDVQESFQIAETDSILATKSSQIRNFEVLSDFGVLISERPELKSDESMTSLGLTLEAFIFLLDKDGSVDLATSEEYDLSMIHDKDSSWYKLNPVLKQQANQVSTSITDYYYEGTTSLVNAVRRVDKKGVIVFIYYDTIESTKSLYTDYEMPEGYFLIAITEKDYTITSSTESRYTGMNISDIGLKDSVLVDGFVGDLSIDGMRCFTVISKNSGIYSCLAVNIEYLVSLYAPLILLTLALGIAVSFVLIVLQRLLMNNELQEILMFDPQWQTQSVKTHKKSSAASPGSIAKKSAADTKTEKKDDANQGKDDVSDENDTFYREQDGELRSQTGALGRWLRFTTPFHRKTADEKLNMVLHILAVIVLIILYILYRHSTGIADNTISYLVSEQWVKGFNIYSISYAFMTALFIMVFAILLRRLVLLIGKNFGTRGETIARLLDSFISYVSIIASIAIGLTYLGVNTTAIITSIGIVGLGVSLGAKDLITDILAGISIVFEGEFRKDDIVEINGFRGIVQEIGIRTTKVTALGNVKVFRNSEVSGVLNLTKRHSFAAVQVQVARSEPLEKIEKIFNKHLPELQKKYPQAASPITIGGILSITAFYRTINIVTTCREDDRIPLEMNLRRDIELLMEREHIRYWSKPDGFEKS